MFSKSSCNIADIEALIFGPATHTFKAYRLKNLMAINDDDNNSKDETHFYGWQCVSLKLPKRTVDFVIKDQKAL